MPLPLACLRATIDPVKLDIADDDIPLLIRALEHYAAYLEASKRRMDVPCPVLSKISYCIGEGRIGGAWLDG